MLDLEFQNIHYKNLLKDISFKLTGTGITSIMGANGAGKTLLLQIISGLLPMDSGVMKNAGKDITPFDLPIAFALQNPIMLRRSVADNLKAALQACGVKKSLWQDEIDSLLRLGHLQDFHKASARLLSGGEKQKLSLLRALVGNPKLLLLDEPCASLDLHSTKAIEKLIKAVLKKNIKICLVTHDIGQAKRLADEVIFMAGGRICEVGRAKDFFAKPKSKEANNYLQGKL